MDCGSVDEGCNSWNSVVDTDVSEDKGKAEVYCNFVRCNEGSVVRCEQNVVEDLNSNCLYEVDSIKEIQLIL